MSTLLPLAAFIVSGGGGLVHLVVGVIVLAIVCGLLYWLVTMLPLPDPFGKVARSAIVFLFVIVIIVMLLNAVGWLDFGGHGAVTY